MATDLPPITTCTPVAFWDREQDQDLVCIDVRQETHDVKTFSFRSREPRQFGLLAGQYFRFELVLNGEPISRCYSVSSSTLNPSVFSVTVKRVPGGRVSNWMHDNVHPGMNLHGVGPSGAFTLPPALDGPFLFISGGSGVTPVMSMLRTLADARLHPDIVFLHAGRSPADLVFRDELLYRAKVTPHLRVLFLPEKAETEPGYSGITGRISEALLQLAVPDLAQRTVMCCGPAPFMAAVRTLSQALGVPPTRYVEESFDGSGAAESSAATEGTSPPASSEGFSVTFAKQAKVIPAQANQSVLAAVRQAGLSMPSSCGNGLCGTCKTKLVSGQVDMQHTGGIRQREVDAGFFLPCCSKPLSDLVIDR